ncbi:hypothetical protein VTN96DRAFT_6406 [Rasamsonia emersonii]
MGESRPASPRTNAAAQRSTIASAKGRSRLGREQRMGQAEKLSDPATPRPEQRFAVIRAPTTPALAGCISAREFTLHKLHTMPLHRRDPREPANYAKHAPHITSPLAVCTEYFLCLCPESTTESPVLVTERHPCHKGPASGFVLTPSFSQPT